MAREERRAGAGRRPAPATGAGQGREAAEPVTAGAGTPLDAMLAIMNEATDVAVRLEAAKAAAPYLHPRLSTVQPRKGGDGPTETNIEVSFVQTGEDAG